MSDDDDLLARLRNADPARNVPASDAWIESLAQSTMQSPMEAPMSTTQQSPAEHGTRRTWFLTAAAAIAVAALALGGWSLTRGDDAATVATPKTVMTLKGPAQPDVMAMCMRVEPETVATMQVAFDGTVTAVEGNQVTLDVNRWYAGGDTDQVTLTQVNPDQFVLLEGGVTLEDGQRYLVTAYDGQVNGCGFSAAWSQELQDIFDQAFAG